MRIDAFVVAFFMLVGFVIDGLFTATYFGVVAVGTILVLEYILMRFRKAHEKEPDEVLKDA